MMLSKKPKNPAVRLHLHQLILPIRGCKAFYEVSVVLIALKLKQREYISPEYGLKMPLFN
jgi:hypothetical protein